MSDYSRSHDFSVKDGLASGNPSKLIKGSEVDDEFDSIVTMSATKADKVVPSAAGNLATLDATGNLQDSGSAGIFPSGTKMLFQQTAAPTGWTKVTASVNDKALRVVSGTVGSGGTDAFSTCFSSSKTTESHTLTAAQSGMPSHSHTISDPLARDVLNTHGRPTGSGAGWGATATDSVSAQNASSGHSHDVTLDLQYLDVIVATKD